MCETALFVAFLHPLSISFRLWNFRLHLGRDLGLGVRHLDAELLRASDDVDALAGRDVVGDPADVSEPRNQK